MATVAETLFDLRSFYEIAVKNDWPGSTFILSNAMETIVSLETLLAGSHSREVALLNRALAAEADLASMHEGIEDDPR